MNKINSIILRENAEIYNIIAKKLLEIADLIDGKELLPESLEKKITNRDKVIKFLLNNGPATLEEISLGTGIKKTSLSFPRYYFKKTINHRWYPKDINTPL